MRSRILALFFLLLIVRSGNFVHAQINTDRVLLMGRNALYYEDYVLAIQRFNMVISVKPWLGEPYFYRGLAKFYLEDYAGAEMDCTSALEKNPYTAEHFELRALCRINQERYKLAEADYKKAIAIKPLDHNCWHNLVLCQMEQKEHEAADSSLDVMIHHWPKESMQYTLKAQVSFARNDTLTALKWVERALEVNEYDGTAWSMKAMVCAQQKQFAESEKALDRAILQQPKNANLYINRALARYEQANLRGAMSDYDAALEMEVGNYLAHFNRGLLRAQVGLDNLAIEDFNFVIEQEPDNMIALYNRALLLDNTGDFKGAVRDITTVIDEYPEFWAGYQKRAQIRRKLGEIDEAERDEFKILQAQLQVATGTYKSSGKTRKKSEKNIEDYNKLVEEDFHEEENEYVSCYRGRVQNRQTDLKVLPNYVLAYYRETSEVEGYVPFWREVETINQQKKLSSTLFLTNHEGTCSDEKIQMHFQMVTELTETLDSQMSLSDVLFCRALEYYHVRDFENSLADLNTLLADTPGYLTGLFLRAQVRCAQMDVMKETIPANELRLNYLMAMQDLNKCIELAPDVPYFYYNKGGVLVCLSDYQEAVESYNEAVRLDDRFPEAYYNRGVAHLLAKHKEDGLSDLSRAGELGLYSAYNLIKRYSSKNLE